MATNSVLTLADIDFDEAAKLLASFDLTLVHVADGGCRIETDPPEGQRRDATITIVGADFLRLVTGQLNPVRGVLSGALKVKGDRAKALALNAIMVPPQPRR